MTPRSDRNARSLVEETISGQEIAGNFACNARSTHRVEMQPGNAAAGSASTLVLLLVLFLLCFVPPCVRSSGCPALCSCKWKSGKVTAECANQNLTSVPEDINPDTQVLDLSENSLSELPSLVFQKRGLVNLQKVFLSRCLIRRVASDAFYQLSNLVELDLAGNLLDDVPTPIFVDVSMLRRLLMERNPIRSLQADSFGNLTYLTMLDLSDCLIVDVWPGAFRGLRNLEILKLDGNELTVLGSDVLRNLPPLYAFSLDRNPWRCDCHLADLRSWISGNNVPTSIPPRCESPERLKDASWTLLAMEEFACPPEMMSPAAPAVTALEGDNATLECVVSSIPDAVLEWTKDGLPLVNLSEPDSKYRVETRGRVSLLHVADVDAGDSGIYACAAENPAGSAESNFTLTVLCSASAPLAWSKGGMVGAALGAFVALVLVAVAAFALVLRYRALAASHSKFDGVGILKRFASKRKEAPETRAELEGASEKAPRRETGDPPDLAQNGPAPKAFLYSRPQDGAPTAETFDLRCRPVRNGVAGYHGYSNEFPDPGYQQVEDPYEGRARDCDTDLGRDSGYGNPGAPAPSTVTWKRTPIVVPNSAHFELPPDRRYSPDEGYAEEALEGTEV